MINDVRNTVLSIISTDIPKNMAEVIDTFSAFTSTTYNLSTSKFNFPPDYYFLEKLIYNNSTEIEKVSHRKILNLVNSNLTAPTTKYPVYTMDENGLLVYPTTITSNVTIQYLRYPKDPNWTYSTTPLGDPLFNPGAATYQDFELPLDDFANLVVKILEYSGISIREQDVVSAAKAEEVQDIQQKQ